MLGGLRDSRNLAEGPYSLPATVMTEPSLLQGEERGGSDALVIVTDERRRPCGKIGPPLRGRPEELAGCVAGSEYGPWGLQLSMTPG